VTLEHHFPQALADAEPVLGKGGGYLRKKLTRWVSAATGVPKRVQTRVLNSACSRPKPVAFPVGAVKKTDKRGDSPAVGQTELWLEA
jgi:hypothetical protein